MKISWVIPLYNCEKYIERCINSIISLNLDEKDFEIVIVNDGSTDSGPEIVNRLAMLHKNIVIINQCNMGVGRARNAGIAVAKGDYLHFIDADDILIDICPGSIISLLDRLISSKIDICALNGRIVKSNGKIKTFNNLRYIYSEEFSLEEYVSRMGFSPSSCFHMFNREFLLSNDIKFLSNQVGEDQLFMMEVYKFRRARVINSNTLVYMYYQHQESATHKKDKKHVLRSINDLIDVYIDICKREYLCLYPKSALDSFVLSNIQCAIIIDILKTKLKPKVIKSILFKTKTLGLYPIQGGKTFPVKCIDIVSRNYIIASLASALYRLLSKIRNL